jgi:hypothetical protein
MISSCSSEEESGSCPSGLLLFSVHGLGEMSDPKRGKRVVFFPDWLDKTRAVWGSGDIESDTKPEHRPAYEEILSLQAGDLCAER